ncbi:MAG: hypothetical protein HQL53_10580 [Magnetococcales bacterium]|nr:hypothetical protein [Magnetococcales bacterium]
MNRFIQSLLVIFALVLWIGPQTVWSDSPLRGPAFDTNRKELTFFKPAWIQQPVQYQDGQKNLDLHVTLDQHFFLPGNRLINAYAKKHNLRVSVQEGTCGTTAGKLGAKAADIGGFCCPPGPTDRLPGLQFHTIGIVPNVFITHPNNPLENITMTEAQELFSGEIDRWNQLSDPKAKAFKKKVRPITRLHCKIRPGHWRAVLDNEDLFSPIIHNVGTIPDMMDSVAANSRAIGWVAHWLLEQNENAKRVNMLKIDGIHPNDVEAIAAGRYPTYKVLVLSSWHGAAAKPEADKLIEHLLSIKNFSPESRIIPAHLLRENGWKFDGNELVGEPGE